MKSENIEQNTEIQKKEGKKDVKFLIIPYISYCIHKVRLRFAKFAFRQKFLNLIASISPVLFAGST